jgi:Flp pilus assembly protein TadG
MSTQTTHHPLKPTAPASMRSCRARRGSAVMETALVLSVLVMLSMGAAEYGMAFYLKHVLQQAAYVGCRAAIMPSSTDAQVASAVSSQMTAGGFGNVTVTVTTNPSTVVNVSAGTYVTVNVSCNWSQLGMNPLPSSLGGFPTNKTFTCGMTMAHE